MVIKPDNAAILSLAAGPFAIASYSARAIDGRRATFNRTLD